MASIGPIRTAGFSTWVLWVVVHPMYLVGFRNRVSVLMHWTVSFVGRGRSERTATLRQAALNPAEAAQRSGAGARAAVEG